MYHVVRFLNDRGDVDCFHSYDPKWGTTFVGYKARMTFPEENAARQVATECRRLVPHFTDGRKIHYAVRRDA
jgi:hypothetical protein